MRISFGPFAFDPQSRLLWREGAEIALPPRVLGVLEALLDRAGDVVARQDLLDRVWKDAFVTDTSLAEAVSVLRQALGDDPQAPRYIQTVHRRGYRFLLTPTQTGVKPGSDQGQTGVRPGSDHLRSISAPINLPQAAAQADWQLIPWSIALLCAGLAAAALWYGARQSAPAPPPVSRFELRTAPGTTFDREPQPIALSPDGRAIAWSACDIASGRCAIYVRPADRLDAQPLAGTDGGHAPVFSPDGRWIAFFADGALKKIAASGGAPSTLANAPDPAGAAWGADGRIVFAASAASGLSLVDDQGGQVQPLTKPLAGRGELRHSHPAWIPRSGTRRAAIAFTIAASPDAGAPGILAILAPDSPGVRALRSGIHLAAPAGRGYVLLAAGTDLQAATFDDDALVMTGSTDSVPVPGGNGGPQFAVGADALAIVRAPTRAQRIWNDGADASLVERFTSIAIAPDSRRLAGVDNGEIWIVDLVSHATTRMTFGGTNVSPTWSADGTHLLFSTLDGSGGFRVVSRPVSDRNETATPVAGAPEQSFPTSAAADGRTALTMFRDGRTTVGIVTPGNGTPRVLTDGPFDEGAAVFSPDGNWLALESTASGRIEVIVRSAPDGRRVATTTGGGRHPRWSEDGRALYFESGRRLLKAAFNHPAPSLGPPEAVLDRAGERAVAVMPSGRLLIERQPAPDTAVIVLQWLRELRERLPLPVSTPR